MELTCPQIEEELKKLSPVSLSGSLLDRLDTAMSVAADETSTVEEKIIVASSDTNLSALEESLRGLVPYGVPEDMISKLDEAMSRWHEEVPESEKVVPIHPQIVPRRSSWLRLRSVAAVGILGAGVAFLTGGNQPAPVADSIAGDQSIPILTNGYTVPAVFTPHDARSSVVRANDHGVVWTEGGNPVRCLEVHVNNEVQFINERGEKLTIEQPKREVRFMSVKTD
jgi:hypothetical protein